MVYQIYSDGGSRGNPGNAAYGWIILLDGKTLDLDAEFIGIKTNNQAEYQGIYSALKSFSKNIKLSNEESLTCNLDSELIVKQLNGEYKIKNTELKSVYELIIKLVEKIGKVEFRHIQRSDNKIADKLVNICLDAYAQNQAKQ